MALTTEIEPGILLADRFHVRGRLGAGGSATVFLAEDCVLCRDVAIKRLHAEGSASDIQRFRREARLGASLAHPNLVTVFDALSGSDGVLIVMEYVRGRPLSELIAPDGMDPKRLVQILRPVASALDYAHARGVVHRDVKPANILIAEDRRVKIVDLGTATAGHATQITAENHVTGTLAYIAPERLAGESVGEPAADLYSLAVGAFEALTGQKPRRADTPAELLDHAMHDPPPDLVETWPQAPPRLRGVLMLGMDPDPDRRPTSAGAFVRALEAALPDRAGAPPPVFAPTEPMRTVGAGEGRTPGQFPELRDAEPPRRRGWLLPALVCTAALIVMTWNLLLPPPATMTVDMSGTGGKADLTVPPQHSVLVTGILNDDAAAAGAKKTDYSIKFTGPGWFQQESGAIKRKADNALDIDELGGEAVRGSQKTRGGSRWGEDLQERFDLEGSGDVKAELTLWNGKAASAIELAVIPSPIPTVVLVALAVVLTCVGLWIEVRHKVDRFARDLGILTFYAVFLRHGTTPVDAFQGVLSAVLPAFLIGEGIPGGIAWLLLREPKGKKGRKDKAATSG